MGCGLVNFKLTGPQKGDPKTESIFYPDKMCGPFSGLEPTTSRMSAEP